ncbi:hypothetical protein [Methylovirgula ligni]|nr:hypothetical protein [Methylovirgula ligni]
MKGIFMRLGRTHVALAVALALGSPEAAWAQSANPFDWFAPPPPSQQAAPYYDHYHRRCSLQQREYAYINECGELIPSIWDPIPGSG